MAENIERMIRESNDTALIALTRIERAAHAYCCHDRSDAGAVLRDIRRFAAEGIAAFGGISSAPTTEKEESA